MILKIILLPFRAVFFILRAIFFPWYLRWIFRLPWFVYGALAVWVMFLAYVQYQNHKSYRLEASIQMSEGTPYPRPLSQWDIARDLSDYNEVNVVGMYFTALPDRRFDPIGPERAFLPIADDQGREVKAVLVVMERELAQLRGQLSRQGNGDRFAVEVNGTLNRSSDWDTSIKDRMRLIGLPAADDLLVIEPFLGSRVDAVYEDATNAKREAWALAIIAGLLAVFGGMKALGSRGAAPAQPKTIAAQETPPSEAIPQASPWGTFQPQPRDVAPEHSSATTQSQRKMSSKPLVTDMPPLVPHFKSVFPGGGSSFRFKTADQIIRQHFGTLSTLKPSTHTTKQTKRDL